MSDDKLFRMTLKAAKPVAWSLPVVLSAVIYRVIATKILEADQSTVLFVGVSCIFLIPVFFRFGAYSPPFQRRP